MMGFSISSLPMCKWYFWLARSIHLLHRMSLAECYAAIIILFAVWRLMVEYRSEITGKIVGRCPCSVSSFMFGTWGYLRISARRWSSCPPPMWLYNSCPEWENSYIWVDEIAFAMELAFEELAFVDDMVVHFKFAVSMIPAFFVLALICVVKMRRHEYFVKLSNLIICKEQIETFITCQGYNDNNW